MGHRARSEMEIAAASPQNSGSLRHHHIKEVPDG